MEEYIAVNYRYDKQENLIRLNPTYVINNFGRLLDIIVVYLKKRNQTLWVSDFFFF